PAAALLSASGCGDEMLMPVHCGAQVVAVVANDEAELLGEPAKRRNLFHPSVNHPVRQVAQALVDLEREDAHVHCQSPGMIADDEPRLVIRDMLLESVDSVAMVPTPHAPVGEPHLHGDPIERAHDTSSSAAPYEMPAPTPSMSTRSPERIRSLCHRRCRATGIAAAPTLPTSWTMRITRSARRPSAVMAASRIGPFG